MALGEPRSPSLFIPAQLRRYTGVAKNANHMEWLHANVAQRLQRLMLSKDCGGSVFSSSMQLKWQETFGDIPPISGGDVAEKDEDCVSPYGSFLFVSR